jgi:hypothetical protein
LRKLTLVVSLMLLTLPAAACGGKSEAEKKAEAAAKSGEGTVTCEGTAMSGDAGLPANFPVLPEMTLVNAEDKGPTRVVDGFATDELEGVYRELKDRLQEEQFTILFDEIEKDHGDSEISYKSPDGKTEGQVALRAACDNGNTSIHITARPAD